MSTRSEVLMWAQRVIARRGQPAHVLLELKADAGADEAQAAFHKIARSSHPDLHRSGLTPEELEMVTSAYAAVAGAYQELRTKTMATTRMQPLRRDAPAASTPTGGTPTPATPRPAAAVPARPAAAPAAPAPAAAKAPAVSPPAAVSVVLPAGAKPETAMSQKALLYYRKAELALKRGDLKGAILQLKLGCATDPASAFLKSALAQVETEVKKTT